MRRDNTAKPTKSLLDVFVLEPDAVKDRLVVCAQIAKRSHQQSDEQYKYYGSHSHSPSLRPATDCSFLHGNHAGLREASGRGQALDFTILIFIRCSPCPSGSSSVQLESPTIPDSSLTKFLLSN
jgi:hypothetical protein